MGRRKLSEWWVCSRFDRGDGFAGVDLCQNIPSFILNMCGLLYVSYPSIKWFQITPWQIL